MITEETLRLKLRNKIYLPLTAKWRRKQLKEENFTIISNNCWGGTVYESYGIKKMSPTVGMFIMPDDYLKLVSDLKHYLACPLEFVSPDESKWKKKLSKKSNWGTYLIGRLDDIELHMLHYHDEKAAKQKWQSRVKRVNYERLIFKLNDQNECTVNHIKQYLNLPLDNKLCFVSKPEFVVSEQVLFVKQPSKYLDGIKASREPFGKSKKINITKFINNI